MHSLQLPVRCKSPGLALSHPLFQTNNYHRGSVAFWSILYSCWLALFFAAGGWISQEEPKPEVGGSLVASFCGSLMVSWIGDYMPNINKKEVKSLLAIASPSAELGDGQWLFQRLTAIQSKARPSREAKAAARASRFGMAPKAWQHEAGELNY